MKKKPSSFSLKQINLLTQNGFFIILILLFFLYLYSYYLSIAFQKETKQSLLIHHQKIELTGNIYAAMQKRNFLLSQMFQATDVFERDALFQELYHQGSVFITARDKLLKIGLLPKEQAIFDRAKAEISKISPLISQTADLLMEDRVNEAGSLWNYNTYGYYLKASSIFNELIQIQNREAREKLYELETNFVKKLTISMLFISFAFLIGLALTFLISKQLKRNTRQIHKLNRSLEQKVKNRTLNLEKANQQLLEEVLAKEKTQKSLEKLAHYDTLTKLPNRAYFNETLTRCLQNSNRQNTLFSLLFIDLDRFKAVNDLLGHDVGDELLKQVSQRLLNCTRQGDFTARIGGDEFTIIANNTKTRDATQILAQRIIKSLTEVFNLFENEAFIGCSIGIAMYPLDASDIQTLIKKADTAMYYVKEEGRNNYAFYHQRMSDAIEKELCLNNALHSAITNKELINYYQPILDMHKNTITGVEILLRWNAPNDQKQLTAVEFIRCLEKTNAICEVGFHSLKTACLEFKQIEKEIGQLYALTFNVCARQILDKDFLYHFCEVIEETGYDYQLIEIDITESVLIENHQAAIKAIDFLRKKGVSIALDNFKAGFPILEDLERFPIDSVKINRHFFQNESKTTSAIIMESVVKLAHKIELTVLAKAVENQEEFNYLARLGCDLYQGNYACPVSSSKEIISYIKKIEASIIQS